MSEFEKIFKTLGAIDVSKEAKALPQKKDGKNLKYLSWAKMVEILDANYPEWNFRIHEFNAEGVELAEGQHGYLYQKLLTDVLVTRKEESGKDDRGNILYMNMPVLNPVTGEALYTKSCVGYNVKTSITINDVTREMWLYVMDSHNQPCKDKPYVVSGRSFSYSVPSISADLLNKSIMRCLVKNAAMFGLGLNLYNGEDLPVVDEEITEEVVSTPVPTVQKKEQVVVTPKKVEPQPKFQPTAAKAPEPVKATVPPVQPKPTAKVNAAEPVAKIPEMVEDSSLMSLTDALKIHVGKDRTFQYFLDAGGKGLTADQQKNSKARLVSFSSRNDEIGKAARSILNALERGECSFQQA